MALLNISGFWLIALIYTSKANTFFFFFFNLLEKGHPRVLPSTRFYEILLSFCTVLYYICIILPTHALAEEELAPESLLSHIGGSEWEQLLHQAEKGFQFVHFTCPPEEAERRSSSQQPQTPSTSVADTPLACLITLHNTDKQSW